MGLRMVSLGVRFRTECRDLVELVLFPGLAAVLPWPWCFALFKRMARWTWLYREQCEAALTYARSLGWAGDDAKRWIGVRRLVTLVDHADHYLGLTRSDAWMDKYLSAHGKWPDADKAVLLTTFHWGAGYWGLRHAAAHGLRPHALVATLTSEAYAGRSVLGWYARQRNANVARTLGDETIDASKQLKRVVQALRNQRALLGVMDVPADAAAASMPVQLLGKTAYVPRGLLRLAVDQNVPVVLYVTGLDTANGNRFVGIELLGAYDSVDALADALFSRLNRLIAENPAAWHFWAIAERFFNAP